MCLVSVIRVLVLMVCRVCWLNGVVWWYELKVSCIWLLLVRVWIMLGGCGEFGLG